MTIAAPSDERSLDTVRRGLVPLSGDAADYDALIERVGDARVVLLGEASHGTHEFYRERAAITQRLIREKGFAAVAAEADWPDAQRVNRYVRGRGDDGDADSALAGFGGRFPTWMWRNTDVRDFVEWLRTHNAERARGAPEVGFYGMDLYNLYSSIEAVIGYLDRVDPEAAGRARDRYGCFEEFASEAQAYGYAAAADAIESCEDDVVAQLVELRRSRGEYVEGDGKVAAEAFFSAEQNARLVRDAEQYYRAMFRGRVSSWNLRDRHMAGTVDALLAHLRRQELPSKVVVWAHNSHLGDARATEMNLRGELNVGQLMRERHGGDAVLVGFTTDHGTVTAASEWDGVAERKVVRAGAADSYEGLFHRVGVERFLLLLTSHERGRDPSPELAAELRERRLERAIGVIYRPHTERMSHYFHARLADQFDPVLHFDETTAVEPLDPTAGSSHQEPPETFPSSL